MVRELPFQTIGDTGRHGLELHVYCPSCYSTRRLTDIDRWSDRCFATAFPLLRHAPQRPTVLGHWHASHQAG
jgi:hypothetical protein